MVEGEAAVVAVAVVVAVAFVVSEAAAVVVLAVVFVIIEPVILVLLVVVVEERKKGNVLFNDALNTFYLQLYVFRHMVADHSDSDRGNPLPSHMLLFPISSKGSFICTIPQTG